MDTPGPRPLAHVLAVVLLAIIALGSAGLGLLLLAVDGSDLVVNAGVAATVLALASLAFAALSIVAGIGLWGGRAWGWAAGMLVALIGLLSIATATLTGAFQPQLVVGVTLFGGLLVMLLLPSARARSGIA